MHLIPKALEMTHLNLLTAQMRWVIMSSLIWVHTVYPVVRIMVCRLVCPPVFACLKVPYHNVSQIFMGPVVQSIESLIKLLPRILFSLLVHITSVLLIFLLKKCKELFYCKSSLPIFQQKYDSVFVYYTFENLTSC